MSGSTSVIPKRVLVIAPTPFFADRGCHVHIAEQTWALNRRGLATKVVTYGLGRDLEDIDTIRTVKFPWYKKLGAGPSWHKFYIDFFLLWTSWRVAHQFEPDVIHAHLHEGALLGWLISRLSGIPLVFDCQGSLTGELLAHNFPLAKPILLRNMWLALERFIDQRADHILAQSTNMLQELTHQFGIPRHKITMAYDGVNANVFVPGQKNQELLKQLDIPTDSPIIVFLGVLTPYQGVDDLLHAFPLIKKAIPKAILLVMGYPNVEKYKQLAQELGIAESTRFTGRVPYEKAADYLALGDVAVSPKRSQTEANGKIYNYMACGLPTVAFDTVVNRDILGDLGLYVGNVGDQPGLARAIIDILNNPQRREELAASVRQRAVDKYSWDNVAGRIITAYTQVMQPWQLQVFQVSVRKKEKWQWVEQQLRRKITEQSKCLDVGSGVGTLSILQERLGGQWEFTETDAAAAAETRKIVKGSVYVCDIFDSRLEANSYQLITILDVIEHVPDPLKFMQRAAELLKPGGQVILTTPADDGRFYFWRRLADSVFGIDKDAHAHEVEGFAGPKLKEISQQAQLKVIRLDPFSFFFTEMVELAYNAAYIMKNRKKQTTRGYNVSLSPASGEDVARHTKQLAILRVIYPLLRGISLLDHVIPQHRGYEWGLVVEKS